MRRESIVPIIIDNYDDFTSVEKVIADYFIGNRYKEDFSSKAIKEKLFVSEASLSRFAQKCGFRGYREFVYRYEESFIHNSEKVSHGFQEVLNAYHQLLNQMVDYVEEVQIERLIYLINNAKRVLVFGIGSSGQAAKEMKNRFMRLGVLMEAVDQADEMRMQSVFQDTDTLVIGLTLSGKKEEVLFSLRQAFKHEAKTVIITANKDIEYPYCDEKIMVPSFRDLDAGNSISPQFPILVILDICYNYFLHNDNGQDRRIKLHQRTVEVLHED
jgi:DNA-binding MurR/RpiR family transcriptional regulator